MLQGVISLAVLERYSLDFKLHSGSRALFCMCVCVFAWTSLQGFLLFFSVFLEEMAFDVLHFYNSR